MLNFKMNIKSYKMMKSIKRNTLMTNAHMKEIRVCKECVYYNEGDDTCKVMSMTNHKSKHTSHIRSLVCRTRDDLCGVDAKFYKKRQMNTFEVDDVDSNNIIHITYFPDGSSGLCGEGCNIDEYYDKLHLDYVNIY